METELTLIQKEGQLKKLTGTFKKDWEPYVLSYSVVG